MLCLFLFAMMFGACQPDVNEVQTPTIKPNPIHDTLWTSQRTSYRVPDHITDRTKVQMFVGTQSVAADLIYDGELFFMTPEDSGSWSVRVYYDGVLQDFDVKTMTVRGRIGAIDRRPIDHFDIIYPGQTISIPVGRSITGSKVNMFINDQEIAIDSIRRDAFNDQSLDVIYFRPTASGDDQRLVLRIDSAAFVWDPFKVNAHTGDFLKQGAARQLLVNISGLAANGVIHHKVDTGYRRDPQPTAQMWILSKPFQDMPTTWSGDSMIIDFSKSREGRIERVNIRLLVDRQENSVSGTVEYEISEGVDSQYFFIELDRAFWRVEEGSYWLGATGNAINTIVRRLVYYSRSASSYYTVENYRGGTAISSVAIAIDPIQ
jgi:hypothetical protein